MRKIPNAQARRQFGAHLLGQRAFKQGTALRYQYALDRWFMYLGPKRKNWADATEEEATEFYADILNRYSTSYSSYVLTALMQFYIWGIEEGHANVNPFRRIRRPVVATKRRTILSEEAVAKIVELDPGTDWYVSRDRALALFLYATGIRNAEACAMDIDDVDMPNQRVAINNGKMGSNGYASIMGAAKHALIDWIEYIRPIRARRHERALWISRSGWRITPEAVRRCVRRVLNECGIGSNVTPHGLRKSMATHLHDNGADVHDIMHVLRHKRLNTTERYIDHSSHRAKRVVNEFHPLSRIEQNREGKQDDETG